MKYIFQRKQRELIANILGVIIAAITYSYVVYTAIKNENNFAFSVFIACLVTAFLGGVPDKYLDHCNLNEDRE